MYNFEEIARAICELREDSVLHLLNAGLVESVPAPELLKKGLIPGMDLVGKKMESGTMFIPEVLMAAKIFRNGIEILKPHLAEGDFVEKEKVVMATVKGDHHDIGKNLVSLMLESAGFEVIDLGVDVDPMTIVKKLEQTEATLVGLSALLTTTMPMMGQTISLIDKSGLRSRVKILVGGAPVTQQFADRIGADAFAPDAGSATRIAKSVMMRL